jgi:hypothetical protein
MAAVILDPESKEPLRLSDLAYGVIEHSGEHYGQLVVYYRINGMVPPESRPKKVALDPGDSRDVRVAEQRCSCTAAEP